MWNNLTPEEAEINEKIRKFIQSLERPGTRIEYWDGEYRVNCDGADPMMGYRCARAPGHDGMCWSGTKHVDFMPQPAVILYYALECSHCSLGWCTQKAPEEHVSCPRCTISYEGGQWSAKAVKHAEWREINHRIYPDEDE